MGQQEVEEVMQEQEPDAEDRVHGAHRAAAWIKGRDRKKHTERDRITTQFQKSNFVLFNPVN